MNEIRQKLTLVQPVAYQISVPGCHDERWADWAGRMKVMDVIDLEGLPITTLTGTVDQAALQGFLRRLYTQGFPLISVNRID